MDWWHQDEDILVEVLKRLDPKSLAVSGCVNKQWRHISEMESVWEGMCTKHWPKDNTHPCYHPVVVALGGYRRLYLLFLRPVLSSSSFPARGRQGNIWSKEQLQLSLSLLSISCYERMAKITDSHSLLFFCKHKTNPNSEIVHYSPLCAHYYQ
ncbi:hypothetical protein SUGI_1044750 [Cryptomeria japonica]|nr:hypothetical protein SUGI_1044750 [Cryptomeria japonica]